MKLAAAAAAITAGLFGAACTGDGGEAAPADKHDASVATAWFGLQLQLVENAGLSPPVASRAFAYSGVTLYEAIVPGMPDHETLEGQLTGLPGLPEARDEGYDWPTVANSALAVITGRLFTGITDEDKAEIEGLERRFAAELGSALDEDVFDRSVARGQSVAEAIYGWSLDDGGHEAHLDPFPSDYVPPEGPGLWVPTGRPGGDPLPALHPYWSENRPFILESSGQCSPGPPPAYSEDPSSEFYAEALEVWEAVENLTDEQLAIALFWADDPGTTATPPGHWVSILGQLVVENDYTLDVAAEGYARLGIAVADAFIGCWFTKYEHNLVRPVTYIEAFIDPDFETPVVTPPFPEYTSGHSVQSGAAAQVLTDFLGDDVAFTDDTHGERGLGPRSYNSFFEAAEEAAVSRLYGGIHYRSAIDRGIEEGKCIGRRVSALNFRK